MENSEIFAWVMLCVTHIYYLIDSILLKKSAELKREESAHRIKQHKLEWDTFDEDAARLRQMIREGKSQDKCMQEVVLMEAKHQGKQMQKLIGDYRDLVIEVTRNENQP